MAANTDPQQDREIVLGTGKMLGIFFGLTVVCALFFSLGYTFGRNSGPEREGSVIQTPIAANAGPGDKPIVGRPEQSTRAVGEQDIEPAAEDSKISGQAQQTAAPGEATADEVESRKPELVATQPAGYIVQVAAVSKQEDAEALVGALQRKQYPVFVLASSPSDKLFRVQVGPFSDIKDAETMRSKLSSDGYNAILKR